MSTSKNPSSGVEQLSQEDRRRLLALGVPPGVVQRAAALNRANERAREVVAWCRTLRRKGRE